MTKEEKIKDSWGLYWDRLPEHQKKEALLNNGGVSIGYSELQTKLFKDLRNTKEFILEPCTPKSILGIENNNGWNKISEVGYPKDDSFDYHVINFDFPETIEIALRQEVDKRFTHWRIITNPINPIY